MKFGKHLVFALAMAAVVAVALPARAAQLDTDARSAIPHDVQQLIVVDYGVMENSSAAMDLKARILPPELKQLESALKTSGLDENHDIDQLAFAAYRVAGSDNVRIVGLAQGQFQVSEIMATLQKKKVKATAVRNNKLYPMGASGMLVTFLNPTTMLFGSSDDIKPALDCRDGLAPSFLTNQDMLAAMQKVESAPIWSILDQKGTQYMMHSLLGQASQLGDYETVRKRLLSSSYTMDFNNGVKFNLYVLTSDTFTAATMSSLLNAAAMYEKVSGNPMEKQAIDATTIDSSAGTLSVRFAASDSQFSALLQSPLFQNVVR
ncbi:MAG TPA: hypothetical protein VHE33_13060 [Acidobacteriaceae bacterium]|nr:hypothetical protein [Acidobacteriaceae bacterium]